MNAFGPQAPYYLFKKDVVACRLLAQSDTPILHKWLNDPAVLEFYEGRDKPHSIDQIKEKYLEPRKQITRCMIEFEGKPVGYFQFYPVTEEEKSVYGYRQNHYVYGIDLFIGETSHWSKGIGSAVIKEILTYLETYDVDIIVADPRANNARAIKCYEKCGFKQVKLLKEREMHEGVMHDCWLMEYRVGH